MIKLNGMDVPGDLISIINMCIFILPGFPKLPVKLKDLVREAQGPHDWYMCDLTMLNIIRRRVPLITLLISITKFCLTPF